MSRKLLRIVAVLTIGLLAFTACGGSDKEGGEEEAPGTLACDGTALSASEIKLPSDFPIPSDAVLTTQQAAGPSQIVEGFYEADLESAYNEWKDALENADYDILFDEIEDRDSEISYKSPDAKSTGQIALRSECKDSGKTFVHITNRPA